MTTNYHVPIVHGESNSPDTINTRLANLDEGIGEAWDRAGTIIAASGTSDSEVVDARSGETVLNDRLDVSEHGVFNVRREPYGAVGSGLVDDNVAIQAAIDDAEAVGGGIVFLPQGTYRLASPLVIDGSNVMVCGQGGGTILKVKDSGGASMSLILRVQTASALTEVQNVTIENLSLDGNSANQTGTHTAKLLQIVANIDLDEPMNLIVRNVRVYGAFSDVLPTEAGGISVEATGPTNRELIAGVTTKDYYPKNILIEGCICYDNDGWGIGTNWSNGVVIANNICYGNATMGITVWNTQDTIITGNYCLDNESNGINCELSDRIVVDGNIAIQTVGGTALSLYNCWDILIANNTLWFTGASSSWHTIAINTFEGAVDSSAGTTFKRRACKRIKIHGNIIKRVGAGAGGYVINATSAVVGNPNEDITIIGNRLEDIDTIDKCVNIDALNITFNDNDCIGRLVFILESGSLLFNGNTITANFSTLRNLIDLSELGNVLASNNIIKVVANVANIWQVTGTIGSLVITGNISTGTPQRYINAASAGDQVTPMINGNRHNGTYSTGPTNNLLYPPSVGTWARGDVLFLLNAAAATYVGYVCTTAGTPGTWKGFGMVEA